MSSERIDNLLSTAYAKDPEDEAFLAWMNEVLAPSEIERYVDEEERFPTLNVVGLPRSGTTLLNQLAASHLAVGSVNNLVAAFWAAPTIGIRLSKRLVGRGERSGFASDYGRTSEISEPHEFGYFWSSILGYRTMSEPTEDERNQIDWRRFELVLKNMTRAYGCPVVFKPLMLVWHMRAAIEALPKTCFVWIRRDPVDNALSILRAREQYSGDVGAWLSLRPSEYSWLKDESPLRQVAGQVVFVERAIRREMALCRSENVLEISYADLCTDPTAALERMRSLMAIHGWDRPLIGDPPAQFVRRRAGEDSALRLEMAKAIAHFQSD